MLDAVPLFVWGRSRWADLVLSVHWLYERTGEAWLLDLAAKVADQGYNRRDHFACFQWRRKVHRGDCQQSTHVVNNAMAVKQPGVWWRQSGEEWRQVGGEAPHADYEVHPTGPWNYGLQVDPQQPDRAVEVTLGPVGECPFSPEGAPVCLHVRGRRLPQWGLERANAAQPPPPSPVASSEPLQELTLIPYGCTCLRVTEFPVLAG
ncbi:MAG: hypothetical protein AB1505_23375 [Candidatus Latescibacterota bacterium]